MKLDVILNRIDNGWRGLAGKPQVLHTKFGDLLLAGKDTRQAKHLLAQLQRTTEALTKSDIKKWRAAWQRAISVESPNRQMLYDIYRDTSTDAHLSGCIGQRTGFVLAKSFNIEDKNQKPNPDLLHFFEQGWFEEFCRLVLEATYWGHSLIELGDLATDGDGCLAYEDVRLVDRKFVIPEHHRVVTDLGQDWTTGIDYHEPEWAQNLVEVGKPDDLGLLLKASLHCIPKKNVLAAWDVFSELFGMPLRVATTGARDQKEIDRIEEMMQRMGLASYAVLPQGTTIQMIENAKTDAYNVYDKRVDRANSELSKLIKVFENLVEQDAKMLAYAINNQLIPRMIRHGFPLNGYHFAWDESVDYTPEQQMEYEKMVSDRYEVDGKYFADKYHMPVGGRIQTAMPFGSEEGRVKSEESNSKDDDKKDGKEKQQKNFFD